MSARERPLLGLTQSGMRFVRSSPRAYGRYASASNSSAPAICEKTYHTRASQKRAPSKVTGS